MVKYVKAGYEPDWNEIKKHQHIEYNSAGKKLLFDDDEYLLNEIKKIVEHYSAHKYVDYMMFEPAINDVIKLVGFYYNWRFGMNPVKDSNLRSYAKSLYGKVCKELREKLS